VLAALAAAGMAVCVGCGGGGDKSTETSGDPEADRRADLRVGGGEDEAKDDRTLYARLGGEATLTAIVEDMTARVIADPRVNFERKNVKRNWLGDMYKAWPPTPENVEQFKRRMVEFLTLAAGGSTQYTGRDLKVAHEGMKITNSEFDAMVGDIKTSMDKLGTRTREKRELLAIIETTRKQIVEEQ
jgi:hemoglobin